ncbi:MAG: TIGR00266 family protein [Fervidicoccaceae archaeon]
MRLDGVEWEIEGDSSFRYLKIILGRNEKIVAEPGAFLMSRGNFHVETGSGGVVNAISRSLFGGESFFLNTFTALEDAEIFLAPSLPGDIKHIPLDGRKGIIVKDGSFLASYGQVKLSTAWKGITGAVAGSGFIWLKAEGIGGIWVSSFGSIIEVDTKEGKKLIVDNDHIVAFDDQLKWEVKKFKGIKSFLFGGEGFIIELYGNGKVLVQTRNLRALASALVPFLPKR